MTRFQIGDIITRKDEREHTSIMGDRYKYMTVIGIRDDEILSVKEFGNEIIGGFFKVVETNKPRHCSYDEGII